VAVAQKEHRQIYPTGVGGTRSGGDRQPHAEVVRRPWSGAASPPATCGIGITNQRETTVVWDRKTGEPVYNALFGRIRAWRRWWRSWRAKAAGPFPRATGLPLALTSAPQDPLDSRQRGRARRRAEAGELQFGNIDTYLAWELTGGASGGIHITDVTNASRTQLMNLDTLDWDDEMLRAFAIRARCCPRSARAAKSTGPAAWTR